MTCQIIFFGCILSDKQALSSHHDLDLGYTHLGQKYTSYPAYRYIKYSVTQSAPTMYFQKVLHTYYSWSNSDHIYFFHKDTTLGKWFQCHFQ